VRGLGPRTLWSVGGSSLPWGAARLRVAASHRFAPA
jgi:hypothetical protein